jgi:hypothetical protein
MTLGPHFGRGQSNEALDQQYGFFDIKLETKLGNMPEQGLEKVGTYMKKDRYALKQKTYNMGGVDFRFVHYLFWEGELHSIFIRTEGRESSQQFLELLVAFFGPGKQDGFAPRYTWQGQRVRMKYDRNMISGNADIHIVSKHVHQDFRETYRVIGQ